MSSVSFPLFKLPFVALRKAIGLFPLQHLMRLCLCSNRAERIIRKIYKNKNIFLKLYIDTNSRLSVIDNLDESSYFSYDIYELYESEQLFYQNLIIKIGGIPVRARNGSNDSLIETFWEDRVFGIKTMINYITTFFNSPIHVLSFSRENRSNDPFWAMDYLLCRQETIESCFFGCEKSTDTDLSHFLSNAKVSSLLYLFHAPSENFRYSFKLELTTLCIMHGYWLTIDNLLNINCRFVSICDTKFTNTDINKFLKHWLNYGSPRTVLFRIGMDNIDYTIATMGLEVEEVPINVIRKVSQNESSPIFVYGGYDIKRSDGLIGTIVHHEEGDGDTSFFAFTIGLQQC